MYGIQRTQIATEILRKNKLGAIMQPDTKLCYKAILIKTEWHWHKKRHINQWKRREGPQINPHLYGQLMFDKEGKNI